MATREKILVGLTVIALLYALTSLVFSPKDKKLFGLGDNDENLNQYVTSVIKKTTTAQPTELDAYVTEAAEAEWNDNPFLKSPSPLLTELVNLNAKKTDESKNKVEVVYTGYVASNERKLAIINDLEYEVGEAVDKTGYVVLSITPANVVIEEEPSQRKEERNQVILPIEETSLVQVGKYE